MEEYDRLLGERVDSQWLPLPDLIGLLGFGGQGATLAIKDHCIRSGNSCLTANPPNPRSLTGRRTLN